MMSRAWKLVLIYHCSNKMSGGVTRIGFLGHMSQSVCVSCKHCKGPHLPKHVYIIERAG